ncbi:unnamed protein product [Amoebophrya sp. A120]|nr:unnamed protein product [Amoebophrya sp. A120]|eukprot:GSA120T00017929001.1
MLRGFSGLLARLCWVIGCLSLRCVWVNDVQAERFRLQQRIANLPDPNVFQVVSYTTLTASGSAALQDVQVVRQDGEERFVADSSKKAKFPKGLQIHLVHASRLAHLNPDRFCCKTKEDCEAAGETFVGKFLPPSSAVGEGLQTSDSPLDLFSWDILAPSTTAPVNYERILGSSASAGRVVTSTSSSLRPGFYFIALSNCGRRSATHYRFQSGELNIITYSTSSPALQEGNEAPPKRKQLTLEETTEGHVGADRKLLDMVQQRAGATSDISGHDYIKHDQQHVDVVENDNRLLAEAGMWLSPSFRRRRGWYLPAMHMPKVPFYGLLCMTYLILLLVWVVRIYYYAQYKEQVQVLSTAAANSGNDMLANTVSAVASATGAFSPTDPVASPSSSNLLTIHHYVTVAIGVALLEAIAWYLCYAHWNFVGYRWHGMVFFASAATAFKQGTSFVLLLLASMGVGVAKPSVRAEKRAAMVLLFAVYVLTDTFRKTTANMENTGTRTGWEESSVLLVMFPPSLIVGFFFLWILAALFATIDTLRKQKQRAKEEVYQKFLRCVLFPLCAATFLILGYEIAMVRPVDLAHNWKSRWWFTDFVPHLMHFLLLSAICILWRPHGESRYLSYTHLRVNEDEEDGGTVEMSAAIGKPMLSNDQEITIRDASPEVVEDVDDDEVVAVAATTDGAARRETSTEQKRTSPSRAQAAAKSTRNDHISHSSAMAQGALE